MTCREVRSAVSDNCPVCCESCHSEAEDGYNDYLLFGTEPCCNLISHAVENGLDPRNRTIS